MDTEGHLHGNRPGLSFFVLLVVLQGMRVLITFSTRVVVPVIATQITPGPFLVIRGRFNPLNIYPRLGV
jgi:hypothetical protein